MIGVYADLFLSTYFYFRDLASVQPAVGGAAAMTVLPGGVVSASR